MKNDECVIRIISNRGFIQTYHKEKRRWIQITNGTVRQITPEQLLSHILPLLVSENDGKFKLEVIKK